MTIPGGLIVPGGTKTDPFGKIIDDVESTDQQKLTQSTFVAAQRPDPARWAKVLEIAKRLKIAPAFVNDNFDGLSKRDEQDRLAAQTQTSPGLTRWLADPDNVTLAKDELPALARVDRGVRIIAPPTPVAPDAAAIPTITRAPSAETAYSAGFARSVAQDQHPLDLSRDLPQAFETGYNDMRAAAGQLAVAYGLTSPEEASRFVAEANQRAAVLRGNEPAYAKQYSAAQEARRKAIDETVASAPDLGQAYRRGQILDALKQYAVGNVKTVGELLGMLKNAASTGFLYSTTESLPGMVPAFVAGALGGAAGGPAGMIGGTFIGMAPLNVGSEINAELGKRGYDITKPADLIRAYSDPALMAEIRSRAARAGVTSAAVSSLAAGFAGGLTARASAAGAGKLVTAGATAADVAVQAGAQGVAQLAGQVAREKGDLSQVSLGEAAETAISMLGYGIGETAIGLSRRGLLHQDPATAATEATDKASEAIRAQRDAQALSEIGAAIKEAPTTASVPDRVRSLIEAASSGEQPAAVYFDESEWNHYWQSKGASPAKAAADIMGDGGTVYYESQSTGAPIAIPLSDYVSKVAPTEHFEGLLGVARTRPDGMSLGEAHEYLQSLPATMDAIAKEAEAEPLRESGASSVRDTIAKQLEAAGRSKAEAESMAAVYESAFATLGKRAGLDPQLLFDRYQLEVNKSGSAPAEPGDLVTAFSQALPSAPSAGPVGEYANAGEAYSELVSQIMGLHEERRQMLLSAMRAKPDILDLRQGEQGRFRINPETRQAVIDLFKPADRSTFIHETGHFYLEVLGDLATGDNPQAEISKDYSSVLTWLGVENRSQIGKEQHEQFARGFEAYLMEGKAPTPALRDAFYRFKRWLVRLYKNTAGLNVTLSPEVRAVFDRMLATDDEIQRAKTEQQTQPLFQDPQSVGMSAEESLKYGRAVAEANQAAEEEVTQRVMKQLRSQDSEKWRVWRDAIRSAVETEAEKDPVQRALALLQRGKQPRGEALPEGMEPFKLSRQAIVDEFGKERLKELPLPYVYSKEGGAHPDAAAEVLGFSSGDELLKSLAGAPKWTDLVSRLTEERLQAEHGDRISDVQLREVAATAVRGEKRVAVLRKELEILASEHMATFKGLVRRITSPIPPTEEVRGQADKIVGAKALAEIRPSVFERAARKQAIAAREALLKGDIQGAFDAKRKELLATEVFRSAQTAKAAITDGLAEFRQVFGKDAKLAKTHDLDLINAARSVLAEFGIGSSDKPADSYLRQLREYDPEVAQSVQDIADQLTENATNYKEMPFDDFAALRDGIRGLWNMSRRVTQIEINGERRDRIEIRDALTDRARALRGAAELPGYKHAVTGWEKAKVGLMGYRAVARRVEHWIRGFDGGEAQGIGRQFLWNRVSEGATAFRVAKLAALKDYVSLLKTLKSDGMTVRKAKITAPEIDYTFSGHNELLGALLHSGNESNLAKLLVGRGWGKFDEHTIGENRTVGVLDTSRWDAMTKRLRSEGVLTKAHYDYVQGVWDRFERLKPDAQRAHKEQYGRYFDELTAQQFTNEFGTYKGGYYPAKVDPDMVSDAQARADHDSLLGSNSSFMFPSVNRGFTKSRVENYRKPLLLDASAVPQHFDAVLRFTHLGPAVRDVARVVMDPAFRGAMNELDPTIMEDAIVPWLQRAAQQRSELVKDTGRFWRTANNVARAVRNNAALQIMAMNSTVLLEQLTHFPSVLVRVDKGALADAAWSYLRDHKQMTADIAERSPFMATRESAALTEARQQIDKIMLDPSVFQNIRDFTNAHGRFLMAGVQSVMDHITWQAVYDHALETMSEKDAAREADAQVRELLGSYNPEDISKIEGGSAIQRLFTMFYGFFNTKANVLATEGTIAKQVGLKKGSGRATGALFWGFMIPAAMGFAIKGAMRGDQFEDDEEGTAHALLRHFGLSQLEMAGRMVPFAGNAIGVGEAAFGHGKEDQLLNSPAIKMVSDATVGTIKAARDLSDDEELTSKHVTDFMTLIGLVSGLPLRPVAKPIGYLRDVESGRAQPAGKADLLRGALTGH